MNKVKKTWKRLMKKSPLELAIIGIMLVLIVYVALPGEVYADETASVKYMEDTIRLQVEAMQNSTKQFGVLPSAEERQASNVMQSIPVTAYNSVPWQTDATPCIGAQGTDICAYLEAGSNTCAANFVPLGTVLEVEGLGTCVVRDRMNARYYYRVDWYMGMDVAAAKSFGVQYKQIGVYPS